MYKPKANTQLSKHPYVKPIMSIFDNLGIKAITAFSLQVFSELGLGEIYTDLITSPPKLIVLVILLVFIDFISGIIKSVKKREVITSFKMRHTIIKSLEYLFFLGSIILFANAFSDSSDIIGYLAKQLKVFAFFLVSIVEINSIVENISNKKLSDAWKQIKEKFNIGIEDNEK